MMTNTPITLPGYQITDSIYGGSRTLVYRAIQVSEKQPVIIKILRNPHPHFNELVQFRNQYVITRNLDSPYIVQPLALERYGNGYALIMPDDGAVALSKYWQSSNQNLHQFLIIAIQLAEALHYLNQQHIIHKDIKPANILIQPETHQVQLIDFSIASLLSKEQQQLINPNVLEGTLAYISPEQTGRMNRGIDYRTDFYSLGVTFYELLTGELPFQSDDPMELIHCHIAKTPTSVTSTAIPQVLSEMVMKLMSKNSEERYQSALGLKYDLEQCLSQCQETGIIELFELGERDICDRFLIPEKLYGRETEIQELLNAFDRVANGNGEMILVAGFSGIGKTAVVNEVHKPIVRQRGYFIKGKFDQFNRNIPFSAFVGAFRDLMGQLLSESDVQLQQWKSKILDAVGESGQVIIEVIPELERIIGSQPAVPELSGSSAQNRFNLLFGKFVQVFTTKDHPLVIFLDDLQWADSASLNLLKLLMNESEISHLLVLGAYRNNEVFSAHPLMLTLDDIQKQGATLNTLTLNPLNEKDITRLVADTLLCSTQMAIPLSQLVYQKTQGNPFFTIQFLQRLYDDGCIVFASPLSRSGKTQGGWQCDLTQVRQLTLTNDVVEFMVERLRKLPEATQDVLKIAACIGNRFDLDTLVVVCEQSQEDVAENLWRSLQARLVIPESETYKFFQGDDQEVKTVNDIIVGYRFLHDRVQQAAYALIPDNHTSSTHLRIGQRLLETTSLSEQSNRIFDIVNHINQGQELLHAPNRRLQLAQLNLQAGQKAREGTAYQTAFDYFVIGLNLLPQKSWEQHYDLTLALHREGAIAANLIRDWETMSQWVTAAIEQANTLLDRVPFYETQIQACVAQKQLSEAIQLGITTLERLGESFPSKPTPEDLTHGIQSITARLPKHSVEDLIDLPSMRDPRAITILRILFRLSSVLVMAAPRLMPFCMFKAVELSILSGNSFLSAPAYVTYGMILCSAVGDIPTGYRFGQLALRVVEKHNGQAVEAKTLVRFETGVRHWQDPLRDTLNRLAQGYQLALQVGDFESAAICANGYGYHAYFSGQELTQLEKELKVYSQGIQRLGQQTILYWNNIYHQQVLNLLGKSDNPCRLVGEAYDETVRIPMKQKYQDGVGLGIAYLFKAMACYLFNQPEQAITNLDLMANYLQRLAPFAFAPAFHFYKSLIHLSTHSISTDGQVQKIPQEIEQGYQKMLHWGKYAPSNYQHKADLIEAERCRVLGKCYKAGDWYDRAIAGAKENEYIQEEALANELAAKFYLDWGKEKIAAGYMQEAYYCYARWGAKAKTDDLEQRYPHLLQTILVHSSPTLNPIAILKKISKPNLSSHDSTKVSHASSLSINNALDFVSILKASQSLSGTIQLDELLRQLTQIILQYSGGDRCALILPSRDNVWHVEAIATLKTTELCSEPFEDNPNLPIKLIQYVKNTQEVVVIDDLKTDLPILDEYLSQQQPKSLLGLPILNQGQLIGILYLRNQSTSGAFTPDRLLSLNFLCTQAAVSLENAYLYQELDRYSQTLEIKVEERTAALQEREIRLRESEQRYASLASAAPVGIFRADTSGHCIYVNDRWCQITGISAEEALKEGWIKSIHPEDRDWVVTRWYQSVQQNFPFQLEFRFQRPADDRVIWGYAQAIAEKDAHGQVTSYVGTVTDISDRKQAEIALENLIAGTAATTGQDFFPALVRYISEALNIPYAFFAAKTGDEEMTILAFWSNGTLQPTCSYDPSPMPCSQILHEGRLYCEHSIQEMFPEDDLLVELGAESYLGVAAYSSKGEAIGDLCIFDTEMLPDPQWAEQILQVFAARAAAELERQWINNSLERLNQELETKVEERTAELQASQAYYQGIISDQTELICRFLPDRTLTFVNDAYCRFFQKSTEELLGHSFTPFIFSEDRDLIVQKINDISIHNPVVTYEHRVIATDGNLRWQQWTDRALFDSDGHFIEFQAVGRDITALKEAEEIIQRHLSTIEASIDGIGILREGQYIYLNQSQLDLFGYLQTEDLLGKSWQILYPSQEVSRFQEVVFPQVQHHGFWRGEATGKRRDNSLFPLEISLTLTPTGDIIRVCRDISDRKEAERQLQNLIAGTAATTGQDFFPALVIHVAKALNVVCSVVSEYVDGKLRTLAFWSHGVLHPTYIYEINRTPCEIVVQNGEFYCEFSVQKQFPEDVFLVEMELESYLGIALRNNQGNVIGTLCILHTQEIPEPQRAKEILHVFAARAAAELERQRASTSLEELNQSLEAKVKERTTALRESEQRYASLAAAAPVGIFRTDASGHFIYVNDHWCQIAGLTSEASAGEGWIQSIHPEDRQRVTSQWYQSVQENRSFQLEYRLQRPDDGRLTWVYGQSAAERNAEGQVVRYVGTITDISDRKEAEQQLQNLIEGTAATTGQDFFPALVHHIAEALNVSHTLVTAKVNGKLQTLACWANGTLQPTYSYDFSPAPCGQALQHGEFYCQCSIKEKFPEALVLTDMEVESYLGVALYNTRGEAIGDLCILHNQTIPDPQRAKQILQVFAARAAVELERQRASTLLEQLNQSLETKVKERTVALQEREIHLRESQQRYASLAAAAPVGIFRTDVSGKYIYVNDRWCQIAGLTSEAALGGGWLKSIHSDDLDQVNAEWHRATQENLPFQLEYRFQRPDSKQTWVYGQSIAEYDAKGQVMGYVGTITDISPRKQAEAEREKFLAQLAQLNRELEQANQQLADYSRTLEDKVEARTLELKTAQERIIAQEKLASLGTLTAGIAHELRNPLNFVKNYAEGSVELSQDLLDELQPLLQSLEPETSDSVQFLITDLQENATTIRHHSQRAAQIIESMMQHVRLDYEQTDLQPTHLHDLLDQAVKLSHHIKREHNDNFNPTIETDYETGLELVEVVPSSLMRAFINLIDNAYDAMSFKQRQLKADSPENAIDYRPTLSISTRSLEKQVEIRIRDNGCGIAPQIHSQILDPFFTTKPPGEGTGLGLSLTHDIIVKQHQGRLTLDTKLGEFTEILLILPVK